MTRKDYKIIAAAIHDLWLDEKAGTPVTASMVANRLSSFLKMDNGRFDKEKFTAACFGPHD